MPEFVKIFKTIKVDRIYFSLIADWQTMPEEQFLKQAIHLEEHPDHQHFLNVLADPLFEFAEMGNLLPYHKKAISLYSKEQSILTKLNIFLNYKLPNLPKKIKKLLFHVKRSKIKNN